MHTLESPVRAWAATYWQPWQASWGAAGWASVSDICGPWGLVGSPPWEEAGKEGTDSLEVSNGLWLTAALLAGLMSFGGGAGGQGRSVLPEAPLRSLKYMAFGDTGSQLT